MKKLDEEQLEAVKDAFMNTRYGSYTFDMNLKQKGLIKKEFEVGKWYKYSNGLFCISEIKRVGLRGYGFYAEDWRKYDYMQKNSIYGMQLTEATHQEVETALIKEAKKRGFKEGVEHSCCNEGSKYICKGVLMIGWGSREGAIYFNKSDGLIFADGKWATIIEEPKVKEMTMSEVNEKLGYEVKIVK